MNYDDIIISWTARDVFVFVLLIVEGMCNSNLSVMKTNDDLLHQHEEDAMGIYKFRGIMKGTDTPIYYKPKNIAATWGPFFISYWNGGWKITVRNLENSCTTAKIPVYQ